MVLDRRRLALDALTAVLAIGGVALVVIGGSPPSDSRYLAAGLVDRQGPPGPPAANGSGPGDGRTATDKRGPAPLGASAPVHLEIPSIGVSTSLTALGLNADGTVAVPPLRTDAPAGWYRHLASPGEVGPAVILGHVDSARDGPAVFYRLRELRPGDTITVRRADGVKAVFIVGRVAQYPKSAFPAAEVYGPVDHPALRLITCGGTFDRVHREYRGNVIAYATLTATASG